ncbi:hypothetical protein IW262DRAFT_1300065 [Armillaria fumosa]|nr:hypothetical protein IW262DRAFT_1300065 [Armillaria fumosa]
MSFLGLFGVSGGPTSPGHPHAGRNVQTATHYDYNQLGQYPHYPRASLERDPSYIPHPHTGPGANRPWVEASRRWDWLGDSPSGPMSSLRSDDDNNYDNDHNDGMGREASMMEQDYCIEVLEKALKTSPSSVVVAKPFLSNRSTLYKLRSATGADKKRELLIQVAQWSELRTTRLKMPTN